MFYNERGIALCNPSFLFVGILSLLLFLCYGSRFPGARGQHEVVPYLGRRTCPLGFELLLRFAFQRDAKPVVALTAFTPITI